MRAGRSRGRAVLLGTMAGAALWGSSVGASPLAAQSWYVSPDVGWSENRRAAVGGRVGVQLVGGLDLVGQALLFRPEQDALGDPGVGVSRGAWQANANALYVFDRTRALAPYVGTGLRYGRARLSVVADGLRSRVSSAGVDGGFPAATAPKSSLRASRS